MKKSVCCLILVLLFSACAAREAAQRTPLLYPNDAFNSRSRAQVDADIRECDQKADHYVKKPTAGKQTQDVLLSAFEGAAVGTAAGALGGAIMGGSVGRATGAGAAIGGVIGAYGAVKELTNITPQERGFIKACLEEKGYKVTGWEQE